MSEAEQAYEFDEPVQIAEGIYWVGFFDEEPGLHCNPYLLLDDEEAVLIDPGSVIHFPIVARKVVSLVEPHSISTIILHHQDPDLCGAVPVMEDIIEREDLRLVAHSRSMVFVRYYGVRSELYNVDQHGFRLTLDSGRELQFIFTPYLHAPGAMVTWDVQTRTLFSSDLCGAFSQKPELFADESYPERAEEFHRAYMPETEALQRTIGCFQELDPAVVAPQHGAVCRGEVVGHLLARLAQLECGAGRFEPWEPGDLKRRPSDG